MSVHDNGFPHSEIPGSKPAHDSPRLIAVFHVLLRHLTPRHPPCALSSLTQRDAEKLTYFSFFFFLFVDAIQLVRCTFAPACSSRGRRFDRRDGSPKLGSPSRLSIPLYALRPGVLTGPTDLPVITTCTQYLVLCVDLATQSFFLLLCCSSGDDGTRTRDPCLAKAVLSQLSYIPRITGLSSSKGGPSRIRTWDLSLIRGTL
jgi:hypothetical protein